MLLYYVDHGSCYIYIKEILQKHDDYFIAKVWWLSRPSKRFLIETTDKIPYKSFVEWKCHEVPSYLPQ
jgi:hypothetical protein